MIRSVCSVFDLATRLFGSPFFVPHVGAAIRSFSDEVNRAAPDNSLYNHPGDYELHCIAMFDDERGEFVVPDDGVRVLVRGKEVHQSKE